MTTDTEELIEVVAPFGIEIDQPRNDDVLLQCIPNARLRSAIDGSKGLYDAKTGDYKVPVAQSHHLSSFPKTPGMRIYVNPSELSYKIIDPMYEDVELCERVQKWLTENSPFRTAKTLKGVKPQEGELDEHRMKSLCRELLWLLDSKDAKRVQGPIPTMEDVEELPGRFMLNPGSRVGNTQPVYEDEWSGWVANLSRTGG